MLYFTLLYLDLLYTQQTFVLMKTSWRLLSSSSSEDLFETSSRHLDQDQYIHLTHTSSEDVFKMSWLGSIYSSRPYVFKTSSRGFQGVLPRPLAKLSSWHLQNVFQTSLRRLVKMSSRRFKDISTGSHFWEIYGQCRKFASVIKISYVLA